MGPENLLDEELTYSVIGAGFEVYNCLGFGFREHVYVMALEQELVSRSHRVAREVSVTVMYKGRPLTTDRLDMIVDDILVVEVKCSAELHSSAPKQLFSYLRATNMEVGLLLHFGPKGLARVRSVFSNQRPKGYSSKPSSNSQDQNNRETASDADLGLRSR
jgi:GxxExxY protein